MNIYYSNCNHLPVSIAEDHITFLKKYGNVLTEFFIKNPIDFKTNTKMLKSSDIIIAVCTFFSFDIVLLLTEAIKINKPILLLGGEKLDTIHLKGIIKKYPGIVKLPYTTTDNFIIEIHNFLKKLGKGNSDHQNYFSSCINKFLVRSSTQKSIFLCGWPDKHKIARDLSNIYHVTHIDTQVLFHQMNNESEQKSKNQDFMQIMLDRLAEPDCILNGYIMDGFPIYDKEVEAVKNANICPNIIFYLDTAHDVLYDDIYQNFCRAWDSRTIIVRINVEMKYEQGISQMCQTINYFLSTESAQNATFPHMTFYPVPPFIHTKSDYFFDMYSQNPEKLHQIVVDFYRNYPVFQGKIKIHPIRGQELGQQTKKLGIYGSLFQSHHRVLDEHHEIYISGELDPPMIEPLFSTVKKYCDPENEIIVEVCARHEPDENLFYDYRAFLVDEIPTHQITLEFTDLIDINSPFPFDLDQLNLVCNEMGIHNGKWMVLANEKEWIYRSYQFCFSKKLGKIVLVEQIQIVEQLMDELELDKQTIKSSIDRIHGIWLFN